MAGPVRGAGAVSPADCPSTDFRSAGQQFKVNLNGADSIAARSWDVIVVGAGAAGSAFVRTLADAQPAKRRLNVLLLEAGPEGHHGDDVTIPNRAAGLWRSEIDWGYRSTPQQQLQPPGRRMELEQGKTTGGSSCLNYMVWVRGLSLIHISEPTRPY